MINFRNSQQQSQVWRIRRGTEVHLRYVGLNEAHHQDEINSIDSDGKQNTEWNGGNISQMGSNVSRRERAHKEREDGETQVRGDKIENLHLRLESSEDSRQMSHGD